MSPRTLLAPSIPVPGFAFDAVIAPDGAHAYVSGFYGNTVTPIDLATQTPGVPIPSEPNPAGLAINPEGSSLYVVR